MCKHKKTVRLVAWLCVAGCVQANAQSVSSDASAAAPGADQDRLTDIVVTAQRRAERLQDVPITVSAVDAKTAQALGIESTLDLARLTPGLEFQLENGAATPALRGIVTSNTAGDESPIAMYVDGVYQPTLSGGVFALNNIDRIEVLKGPQGTLFGRNAAGGVVQIITRTPQQAPEADFNVTYANYDTISANAYITGGLAPNVAADLSLYDSDQRNGWGHDLATGAADYLTRETSARSKILFDVDDNSQFTLIGSYDKRDSEPGTNQRIIPPFVPLTGQLENFGFYNTDENLPGHYASQETTVSLKFTHDWDVARFLSQSSYQSTNALNYIDLDHTGLNIINVDPEALDSLAVTQEFQVLSAPSSKIKWIGGFFYFYYVPRNDPLRLDGIGLAPFTAEYINDSAHTRSYSAFGETTAPILADTDLTAGVRYTSDQRSFNYSTFLDEFAVPGGSGSAHKTFDKVTYRLTVDHKFTPDILAFGTVSRGFKSGLYNISAPTTPVVKPETLDAYEVGLKSDLLDGRLRFNLSGFHYKFEDIQLQEVVQETTTLYNAANSHSNGIDLDVSAVPLQGLQLRAAAEYLDAKFTDFPDAAFYTPNVNAEGIPIGGLSAFAGNASGHQMPRAAPWTGSFSAQYTYPISYGSVALVGNYNYNSGYYWEPQNIFRQPKTNMIGASLKWTDPRERWDVRLWGRNLTNQESYSYVVPLTFGIAGSSAEPRTYGLTVGAHF
jgi:iron complex outermembrane receptor protein